MKNAKLRYLTQQDIIHAGLTLRGAVAIIEDVLKDHAEKQYANPPKPAIHPREGAFFHAMPGYLPRKKATGIKWISGFSSNPKIGLPSITGLVVLNDVNTGVPVAVMDATYITAIRTAAVTAVAAKYLSTKTAATIGIVGAGVQGRYNLFALREVLPEIQRVRFYVTDSDLLRRTTKMIADVAPFDVEAETSARHVIEDADIVLTATGMLAEAIFKADWVQKVPLVLPIHSGGWEREAICTADKFIVDDWKQFSAVYDTPGSRYAPLPELYAELGEIVAGIKPGREDPSERIINFNFGIVLHDIAIAKKLLIVAREKGIGRKLPWEKAGVPFLPPTLCDKPNYVLDAFSA
ncbi:MAG: ornithine cyclodeaminase family protein [Deltaproteobacteria bacterium]|nr:ornithine cyclodeaminase family protein [Deltaproteobacteria bacterium]